MTPDIIVQAQSSRASKQATGGKRSTVSFKSAKGRGFGGSAGVVGGVGEWGIRDDKGLCEGLEGGVWAGVASDQSREAAWHSAFCMHYRVTLQDYS